MAMIEIDPTVLQIERRYLIYHNQRKGGRDDTVEEKARLNGILQQFVDSSNVRVGRSVQNNNDRSKKTDGAAHGAQYTQFLIQEVGSQNSTVLVRLALFALGDTYPINTLRAPKGVTKIAGAKAYAAKLAISPSTIIMIPAHHNGLCR
jgi:hypothetical protein